MSMKNQLKKSLPNNSDYICCFSRCRGLTTKSLIAWLNKTILKLFYFRSPLILRGGMEGINNLGLINLPRSLRHAFLVMTVQLKQNPASFLKAGEKT